MEGNSRLPYAGMTRIRFEGFTLSAPGAHPQPLMLIYQAVWGESKLEFH